MTEPLGSAEPPNLTEPVSSAEPEPEPERFGLPLVDTIVGKVMNSLNNNENSEKSKSIWKMQVQRMDKKKIWIKEVFMKH